MYLNFSPTKTSLAFSIAIKGEVPAAKNFLWGGTSTLKAIMLQIPLREFLRLLGFDVVEGEHYSSQPIPEKVRARIDDQSLYLALITNAERHDWLTAEAAYALGKDKHVIVLIEEGTKFNPTILGTDLEQIRFPVDTVERSFISLLREFRDIGVRF